MISASGDGCSRFNALLRLPIQFKQFLNWILTSTGEVSDAFVAAISDRLTPVGAILIWPAPSLPSANWLICNGQPISRADYPILFQRISTIYGVGDGSLTFNLPDYQSLFIRGVGPSNGLGVQTGSNDVTLVEGNIPAHKHGLSEITKVAPDSNSTVNVNGEFSEGDDGASTVLGLETDETGDGTSFAIVPLNKSAYYIIKAK